MTARDPGEPGDGESSRSGNFISGTASFSMEPSHYAPVKEELADLRVAS